MDKPVLKAGANFHKYKVKRNFWPKVRGCVMNPVEHPHGGGNHQHVGHPTKSSRQAPVDSMLDAVRKETEGYDYLQGYRSSTPRRKLPWSLVAPGSIVEKEFGNVRFIARHR